MISFPPFTGSPAAPATGGAEPLSASPDEGASTFRDLLRALRAGDLGLMAASPETEAAEAGASGATGQEGDAAASPTSEGIDAFPEKREGEGHPSADSVGHILLSPVAQAELDAYLTSIDPVIWETLGWSPDDVRELPLPSLLAHLETLQDAQLALLTPTDDMVPVDVAASAFAPRETAVDIAEGTASYDLVTDILPTTPVVVSLPTEPAADADATPDATPRDGETVSAGEDVTAPTPPMTVSGDVPLPTDTRDGSAAGNTPIAAAAARDVLSPRSGAPVSTAPVSRAPVSTAPVSTAPTSAGLAEHLANGAPTIVRETDGVEPLLDVVTLEGDTGAARPVSPPWARLPAEVRVVAVPAQALPAGPAIPDQAPARAAVATSVVIEVRPEVGPPMVFEVRMAGARVDTTMTQGTAEDYKQFLGRQDALAESLRQAGFAEVRLHVEPGAFARAATASPTVVDASGTETAGDQAGRDSPQREQDNPRRPRREDPSETRPSRRFTDLLETA
jgi:hypothetical protein